MCGRYADFRAAHDLADAFAIDDILADVAARDPSWNVAPTDPMRILVERPSDTGPRRSLRLARWGLVPSWSKNPSGGARMINARMESLSKNTFAPALASRRCLVIADGYYEWQRTDGGKTPYFLSPTGHTPWAFAGLYEFWRDPAKAKDDPDRWLVTATIITGQAQADLADIHDRRPIALDIDTAAVWLDPDTPAEAAESVLAAPGPRFSATRITATVNSVRNNGPDLLIPAGDTRA